MGSGQSGRFQYQRSVVRIHTPANLYRTFTYYQLYCIEKTQKRKSGREWPIFKKQYSSFMHWGQKHIHFTGMQYISGLHRMRRK